VSVNVITGDCLEVLRTLPEQSVNCIVTSPPYWGLRDYGHELQLGLEKTPDEYVKTMAYVFREARRVLRDDGTLWVNLGDSYNGSRGGEQAAGGQMADRSVAAARCRVRNATLEAPNLKPKDLVGIPWRVAFALQADGWYLRSDIIWHKPNPMPESVTDRPTKSHEYIFLFAKSERYYYDADAIAEPVSQSMLDQIEQGYTGTATKDYDGAGVQDPSAVKARILSRSGNKERKFRGEHGGVDGSRSHQGFGVPWEGYTRNKRTVWPITTKAYKGAHFATMAPELAETCILAGCPQGGTVLDPFGGAGTTGLVADRLQRNAVLIELNPEYAAMARERITQDAPLFTEVA
jgi:DNA modification methylase